MPLQVLKPTPRKDQLTALSEAVGIASSIYGIVGKSAQLDKLSREAEEQERIKSGDLTPLEAAELSKGGRLAPPREEEVEGAIPGFKVGEEERVFIPTPKISPAAKELLDKAETKSKQEDVLRKEYANISKTVGVDRVDAAFERIKASIKKPSASGDLALIFNFMKMLDPGSVVRESEFRNAARAGALTDRLAQQAYDQIIAGRFLAPTQREDFFDRAKGLKGAADTTRAQIEKPFRVIGKNRDLDIVNIFGRETKGAGLKEAVSKKKQTTIKPLSSQEEKRRQELLRKAGQ